MPKNTKKRPERRSNANSLGELRKKYLVTGQAENRLRVVYGGGRPKLKNVWRKNKKEIMAAHLKKYPCTRPAGWWIYEAPEDWRQKVSGNGSGECGPTPPDSKWFDHIPRFEKIDPIDPPCVESEAAFLLRHGLLSEDEKKHLKGHPELLKPVKRDWFDAGIEYWISAATARADNI